MNIRFYLVTLIWLTISPLLAQTTMTNDPIIKSIELRNYTLVSGMRDKFSSYMDRIIIPKQHELGGYLMNAFSLSVNKNKVDDHYVWIRGFANTQTRSKFMKDFYYSDYWRQHAAECNSMLIDSYDVHLLKPLVIKGQQIDTVSGIRLSTLKKPTGITVATHYVTNHTRNKLISLFTKEYLEILKQSGAEVLTLLISETQKNDYTRQHVYQDPSLLVVLTHFADETAYEASIKKADSLTSDPLKRQLRELLVSSESLILHPL